MKTVKTISLDYHGLSQLISSLTIYWMVRANQRNLNHEEFYRSYLVKKFYEKMLRRQNSMIESGQKKVNLKFDAIHAILLVDVLQRVDRTEAGQFILSELGSFCPPQLQKV